MPTGALTENLDVAQVVLYVFWLFWFGLVFYLRREDKREGYPMIGTNAAGDWVKIEGVPFLPSPKTFLMADGTTRTAPREEAPERDLPAKRAFMAAGAPLTPTDDPLLSGMGPGAWAHCPDEPLRDYHGQLQVAPMRTDESLSLHEEDPDPRGMPVYGDDGIEAGTISDVWVDRSEMLIRFLEMKPVDASKPAKLLPFHFADIQERRNRIEVTALLARQFDAIPTLKKPDEVTRLEEDKINAFFGGGIFYQKNREPLI